MSFNDVNDRMLIFCPSCISMAKGICLYIEEYKNHPLCMEGGRGRRASTENVPGIVGLGKAIEMATVNLEER